MCFMPAKKSAKRSKVATMEKKVKSFAKDFEKEAKVMKSEWKELGSKIWSRWEVSSAEEKTFTIIGIVLMVRWLYILFSRGRWLFISILLVVLGILFVTGFFSRKKK